MSRLTPQLEAEIRRSSPHNVLLEEIDALRGERDVVLNNCIRLSENIIAIRAERDALLDAVRITGRHFPCGGTGCQACDAIGLTPEARAVIAKVTK